ncbi:hypothetical protein AVEN_264070-1 [Araneus ventricosus]|uniref:Uncharacterized protein n=1 Tax=Araneus ventricosus TaxID=182803 RepID=A0A4Y2WK17_ARAVE|nr:hypothetical protein AVEN_264070-1 [Araneus ventricosus]
MSLGSLQILRLEDFSRGRLEDSLFVSLFPNFDLAFHFIGSFRVIPVNKTPLRKVDSYTLSMSLGSLQILRLEDFSRGRLEDRLFESLFPNFDLASHFIGSFRVIPINKTPLRKVDSYTL